MPQTFSRRTILRAVAAASAAAFVGPRFSAPQNMIRAVEAVDHLLLGARDLDAGVRWVENTTGVTAAVGGSHPGRGTRNALVALGSRRYLEIIAPDPSQPAANLTMNLRGLDEPRLIAWAAATTDIGAIAKRVRDWNPAAGNPRDGSRARPDGRVLKWRTLPISVDFAAGDVNPIPFFIEWAADSLHPSQDSPKGCQLDAFEIEHRNAEAVRTALAQVGIEAAVRQSSRVVLIATLSTPRGRVVIR